MHTHISNRIQSFVLNIRHILGSRIGPAKYNYKVLNFVLTVLLLIIAISCGGKQTTTISDPHQLSTLAGAISDNNNHNNGSSDGVGIQARFTWPFGLAVDKEGSVYLADNGNKAIRKIDAKGMVTTLAGRAGTAGHSDGPGSTASFLDPTNVAVDSIGNVYVTDTMSSTIRKIDPYGIVSTLAGTYGVSGYEDGQGAIAKFMFPAGIAVDSSGNVYVADAGNRVIRKIDQSGNVITFAGLVGIAGSNDGPGDQARFNRPAAITVDGLNNLFIYDMENNSIRKITSSGFVTTVATSIITGAYSVFSTNTGIQGENWFAGISADLMGNVYIVVWDQNNSVIIRKITTQGISSIIVGIPGNNTYIPGALPASLPPIIWGITIGPDNKLYISTEDAILLATL